MRRNTVLIAALFGALGFAAALAEPPEKPPTGPFGLSMVSTADLKPAKISDFYLNDDCALCHERQFEEMKGSFHSVAHVDPLYRAFAELARKEAGEEVYALCSGCHTPAGVVSGLVPGEPDAKLPAEAKAGVTCDVCHQMSAATGPDGPWKEPGNASFVLSPGRVKFGSNGDLKRNPAHKGEKKDFYSKSEYCANCHTVIHPVNGLRIEHTYDEWKRSPYAEKGIQCQDCHMHSVEDAIEVARTMKPVTVTGKFIRKGPEREVYPHYFVGGNSNAERLTGSAKHAEMARNRLRSAATIEVTAPPDASPGGGLPLEIRITNVGAGHNLPTSLTELREMWVRITVRDSGGREVFRSGALDARGDIAEGSIRFGSDLLDASGKKTHRPWEGVRFGFKRLIGPKETATDRVTVALPGDSVGPWTVKAELLYRSAPPAVVKEVMGKDAFEPEIVSMASASAEVGSR